MCVCYVWVPDCLDVDGIVWHRRLFSINLEDDNNSSTNSRRERRTLIE